MKIKKHDYVFIDDGLKYKIYKIVDTIIYIKKCKLNLMFLVNKKYGSTFIYKSKGWVRCQNIKSKLEIDFDAEIEGANKNIFYDTKSQNLSEENIIQLKKLNKDNPYEVIQQIIDNSITFKEKTEISKFKYIEKKMKRHLSRFTVYECTIVNLINYFYKFFPEKVCYIRIDYLANILFHLNKNFSVLEKLEEEMTTDEQPDTKMEENNEPKELINPCEKQNVIVYDDSYGLLSAVLNICFNNHVNVYSLIHRNCSNSLTPFFGIRKCDNVLKMDILNYDKKTYKVNRIYHTLKNDFAFCSEENVDVDVNNIVKVKSDVNNGNDISINESPKDPCKNNENKRKADVTCENYVENKKRRADEELIENGKMKGKHEETHLKKEISECCIHIKRKMMLNELYDKKAESFVAILSSTFLSESKTNVHLLLETLINIALKYLKNDSKFILYVDDFVVSNIVMNALHLTHSFIHIKLNEYILREQQVMERRTHPIIRTAKLADGFLITAIKVAN